MQALSHCTAYFYFFYGRLNHISNFLCVKTGFVSLEREIKKFPAAAHFRPSAALEIACTIIGCTGSYPDFSGYLEKALCTYLSPDRIAHPTLKTGFLLVKIKGSKQHAPIDLDDDCQRVKSVCLKGLLKNLLSVNFLKNNTIIA